MPPLRGLVLCGGRSQRMGSDKGLLPIENTNWASFTAQKLEKLGIPFHWSINPSQEEPYRVFFNKDQLILDCLTIPGPLNGLFSAHILYPQDSILLLACDMIGMKTETLKYMVKKMEENPGWDWYVYKNKEYYEPFCAVYSAKGLKQTLQQGYFENAKSYSFQALIKTGKIFPIPIMDAESFFNHNSIEGN